MGNSEQQATPSIQPALIDKLTFTAINVTFPGLSKKIACEVGPSRLRLHPGDIPSERKLLLPQSLPGSAIEMDVEFNRGLCAAECQRSLKASITRCGPLMHYSI